MQDEDSEAVEARPSRTQRTRDAAAVNQLGLDMIAMSVSDLDMLDLPSDLREAIAVCQGLKLRARTRQKRLVGQLLRDADHAAIRERIDRLGMLRISGSSEARDARRWLERLLATGDAALQDFVDAHPDADRSRLRELMRGARREVVTPKVEKARRHLLEALRAQLG